MDTDTIVVVAQLLTGLATLIVASVLIWQIVMQRKALEMAHRDHEQSLALSSLELTDKLLAVRMENDFSRIWAKRNNSEKDLDNEEYSCCWFPMG